MNRIARIILVVILLITFAGTTQAFAGSCSYGISEIGSTVIVSFTAGNSCQVDWGDGSPGSIASAGQSASHTYTTIIGGLVTYMMTVDGTGIVLSFDDRPVNVDTPRVNPDNGTIWCALKAETYRILVNGNHVVMSADIMGGDKNFLSITLFGGRPFIGRRMDDNQFWLSAEVPIGTDGTFSIIVSNSHTGQKCFTQSFQVRGNQVMTLPVVW